MSAHAKLSASKTKEWMHCPGQVVVEEMFPEEDIPGQAARLGTCAHALGERCMIEGVLPSEYEGRLIQIVNEGEDGEGVSILRKGAKWSNIKTEKQELTFEIDEDMVEAVTCFVAYVCERCIELGLAPDVRRTERAIANVADLVKKGTVRLETRTNLFPFRDDTGGTADVTIDAWPEVLEIVDYKHGSGIFVSVKENPQLRTYGMGVAQETMGEEFITQEAMPDYDLVRMTVVQPRHHDAPPGGVMFEDMSMSELISWRDDVLVPAVARVDEAREFISEAAASKALSVDEDMGRAEVLDALARAGYICMNQHDHKCWFCEKNMDYPYAHEKVQELAKIDFADEPVDIDVDENMDDVSDKMAWIPFLETWIKQMGEKAKAVAMEGKPVRDHKLIRGNKHLAWRDEENDTESIILALTKDFEVDKSKVVKAKVVTPTQALALVKKSDADEELKKKFADDYTYRPVGDVQLVHESKKGTPYVPDTAKADFADVDDEEDAWA